MARGKWGSGLSLSSSDPLKNGWPNIFRGHDPSFFLLFFSWVMETAGVFSLLLSIYNMAPEVSRS